MAENWGGVRVHFLLAPRPCGRHRRSSGGDCNRAASHPQLLWTNVPRTHHRGLEPSLKQNSGKIYGGRARKVKSRSRPHRFFFFLKSETRNKASVGQSPKAEKHVFFSFVRSSRVDCFLQNFPFVFSSPSIGFSFSSFKVRLLVPFLVLLLLFASRASSASSRSYKKGGRDHAKSLF